MRGTTSREIIQMAKDVGAKNVIVASCAPPIRYQRCLLLTEYNTDSSHRHSNVYGIDMPSRFELVAHEKSTEEIAKAIGADMVIFQTLPDLVDSVKQFNPQLKQFDCSVFTGEYITGDVNEDYLMALENLRADNVRLKSGQVTPKSEADVSLLASSAMSSANDTVGLHNSWARG